jgi:hypothetical protein
MRNILALFFLTLSLVSCDAQGQSEIFNALAGTDHSSPLFLESKAKSETEIILLFDEMVFADMNHFSCPNNDNEVIGCSVYENELNLRFKKALLPGKKTELKGRVNDWIGNSLTFTLGLWGYNPNLPTLLINEFTTKGSGNNPDRVELLVLKGGNLAGITLFDGVKDNFDSFTILPSYEVKTGEYVVIEYSPALRGVHEIEFWGGESGLGSNNGVISLYDSPEGTILDAVLYTNREAIQFDGYGTKKVQQRAEVLKDLGMWLPNSFTYEDGIDSSLSTATRSMCRSEGKADTNTKEDWHIVPTSNATFGKKNVTTVYKP